MRSSLNRSLGVNSDKRKCALHRDYSWRAEQNRRVDRFEKDSLRGQPRDISGSAEFEQPAIVSFLFKATRVDRFDPAASRELIQRYPSPAQACNRRRVGLSYSDMHDNLIVTLQLPEGAQRHVVRKPDDRRNSAPAAFECARGSAGSDQEKRQGENDNEEEQAER